MYFYTDSLGYIVNNRWRKHYSANLSLVDVYVMSRFMPKSKRGILWRSSKNFSCYKSIVFNWELLDIHWGIKLKIFPNKLQKPKFLITPKKLNNFEKSSSWGFGFFSGFSIHSYNPTPYVIVLWSFTCEKYMGLITLLSM